MVICLKRGADLHMAQMMPLPLAVSCFSKIQIGFTFLVSAYLGSPAKQPLKRVCVCACVNHPINWRKLLDEWKLGHVTAVYKTGTKGDPSNYRPISLTTDLLLWITDFLCNRKQCVVFNGEKSS